MFSVAAPFWSSLGGAAGGGGGGGTDEEYISMGVPSASSFGAIQMVAAQIDTSRVLLVYQDSSDLYTYGVVVSDAGGGAVSFATPVVISSAAGALGLLAMNVLSSAAGTYICTYGMASSTIRSRIVTVSGGVLTVTGTEDFVADLSTIPSASLVLERSAVLSASFVGVAMLAPTGIYVSVGTVSGGTVTYGAPVLTEMGGVSGQGSRLLTSGSDFVMYGAKYGVGDSRLWACSVSSGGAAVPAYLPPTAADRVHTPTSGVVPGPMAQIGASVHVLAAETTAGGYYCTRAQMSGGVATYSNNDADPNLLSLSTYAAPPTDSGGVMVATPGATRAVLAYRTGTAWGAGMLGISGNVNMAGASAILTPSGTSSYIPAVAFLSEHTFIICWGTTVTGMVCGVGTAGGGVNIRRGSITAAAGTSETSTMASPAVPGSTLVVQDFFNGTAAALLTARAPDTYPVGMTWSASPTSMRTSGTGYVYGNGSAAIDSVAGANYIGDSGTPTNYGIVSDPLIEIDFTTGTSNAPQVGGFSAIGLEGQLHINDINFGFSIAGNAAPNEWRMTLSFGNYVTIATPTVSTNYTVSLDIVGNVVTMTYGIYTLTHTFAASPATGVNAIKLACSSRTGGGIHYRELRVYTR